MKLYYVYMMASHRRVLYTGITGPLEKRVRQHKQSILPESFSSRYRVHKLVYYETFDNPVRAINREKQLKSWRREKKIALINASNPKWRDLSAVWGKPLQVLSEKKNALLGETGAAAKSTFKLTRSKHYTILSLSSPDGMNRLTRSLISDLITAILYLAHDPKPLIITGNDHFFSAGADLREIAALEAPEALAFARAGQELMNSIAHFPAATCAAISGYCMGGGLDLALACQHRIAAPNATFGHRGAALGLMTGWGGTQRLPRLIGKGRAPQMFLAAEKIDARTALVSGLVNIVFDDPLGAAVTLMTAGKD